ncbi:hypothetical protein [Mycobacterium sp. 48b]|uniref:hypothetical protein n=1 Tax=Mycobacterium sp. 48b TaxID=3400426 RepID=UPI003AAED6FD
MTTIGTAVLQIIPSLRGVTEAIESQIDGKAVDIQIKPKVDQRATEQAAKQTRETVEKQTTEVKVQPKVDTRAAEQAGKATGEAVTKGASDAVEKSSTGKDIAKVIVDGIADGVKDELRGGPLVDEFVEGLADGVKQGIDRGGVSTTIISTISDGLKSGNVGGTIKDAVLPTIKGLGTDLRSSATDWSRGIADSLRSGDIQGATDDIGNTVRSATDTIATIGSTFGLQLDGVRQFGEGSATALSDVSGRVQGVITPALELKSKFDDIGGVLETVLPGKAERGAKAISAALALIVVPQIGKELTDSINEWLEENHPRLAELNQTNTPDQLGKRARDWVDRNVFGEGRPVSTGVPQGPVPVGQPLSPVDIVARPPAPTRPSRPLDPYGLLPPGGYGSGGYTGSFPVDQVAGVVHGKEYVVQAISQERIERDHPGLLDHMNATGKLPGYAGGGLVTGAQQLRAVIGERFGISDIGSYRGADKYGEHSTGRALDVMVGNNKSKGDAVKDFALANSSAIDLKWVIWRQHLYYPGGGGYDMPDRGSPTQNHMDHVHIFSGTGIANGLRGALKGVGSGSSSPARSAGPGAIDPSSSDTTGSGAADAVPAAASGASSSSSGGGFGVPSTISGLAGLGGQAIGGDIGSAVGELAAGQVSSALGVFGVNDSPGWLKGISTFVGGLSISDKNGKKVFDGSNIGGTLGGAGSLFGGAAPAVPPAPAPAALPGGSVHGGQAGQNPGPAGTTYHIRTATVEDAFTQAQQQEKVRLASKLDRY